MCFLRYGMTYYRGRLVVPVSGTYFLHSYLELFDRYPNHNIEGLGNSSMKHVMYRYRGSDGKDVQIVSKEQTHKLSSNGLFSYYGSYIAIQADLFAGDEISVKVSNLKLLKHSRENLFGVNLI